MGVMGFGVQEKLNKKAILIGRFIYSYSYSYIAVILW